MTFQELKGKIIFWLILITILLSLITGDFSAAGNLLIFLIVGVIAYQLLGRLFLLISAGKFDPLNIRSKGLYPQKKRSKSKVKIKFYGNNEVSVEYEPEKWEIKYFVDNFLGYMQAVCNYLDEDLSSNGSMRESMRTSAEKKPNYSKILRSVLKNILKETLDKEKNVLEGKMKGLTYKFNKVEPNSKWFRLYEGTFYGSRSPKLNIYPDSKKGIYVLISVLAFLQHIIDNLTIDELKEFYRELPNL